MHIVMRFVVPIRTRTVVRWIYCAYRLSGYFIGIRIARGNIVLNLCIRKYRLVTSDTIRGTHASFVRKTHKRDAYKSTPAGR